MYLLRWITFTKHIAREAVKNWMYILGTRNRSMNHNKTFESSSEIYKLEILCNDETDINVMDVNPVMKGRKLMTYLNSLGQCPYRN